MAGRKKAPLWRQVFLRALRRTGDVRASAVEAGVDPGTAYDHRAKDAGFGARWAEALQAFRAMAGKKRRTGEESGSQLVLRRSKSGDRLVRAAPGRWSGRVEESFLDALEETGCVRTSAASVGMSTQALYARRDKYPEFRARWDERVGRFQEQLPGLINAAAVEAVSPQPAGTKRRGRARLPRLSGGDAVRVYAINENAKAKAARGGRNVLRKPEVTEEELNEALLARFAMLDRRRLAAGWTDAGNGIWLPPGGTRPSPEASAGKPDEGREGEQD